MGKKLFWVIIGLMILAIVLTGCSKKAHLPEVVVYTSLDKVFSQFFFGGYR